MADALLITIVSAGGSNATDEGCDHGGVPVTEYDMIHTLKVCLTRIRMDCSVLQEVSACRREKKGRRVDFGGFRGSLMGVSGYVRAS